MSVTPTLTEDQSREIGSSLKVCRTDSGIDLAQMAQGLKISPMELDRLESGTDCWSLDSVVGAMNQLKIDHPAGVTADRAVQKELRKRLKHEPQRNGRTRT